MRQSAAVIILLAVSVTATAKEAKTLRTDHVTVEYIGVGEAYPKAIARTVEAARAAALESGFDMPDAISVSVTVDSKATVRLFNDGQDRIVLTVRSQRDLRKPATSGIFHIYGLCHEVGHLAMYRVVRDHSWMTTAAAEGWASYFGSQAVDKVYAALGKDLWPDAYDYLADGTKKLGRNLASPRPGLVTQGAGQWKALADIIGDKGIAKVFSAWAKAEIDPTDPAAALRKALSAANVDKQVTAWLTKGESLMIFKRPKSGFARLTVNLKDLARKPAELALDDGKPSAYKSMAGSGHAVRFKNDGDGWCVGGIKIYCLPYGRSQASDKFNVWLCDKDFRSIAQYTFRYSAIVRGRAKWVVLPIKPTLVPNEFIVCVGFNPTASKGVFVYHDDKKSEMSLCGLPGGRSGVFSKGNWMIRAVVDQLKSADSLHGDK